MAEPKGYPVPAGYIGILEDGTKMLFPTEDEYLERINESED